MKVIEKHLISYKINEPTNEWEAEYLIKKKVIAFLYWFSISFILLILIFGLIFFNIILILGGY